MIWSNRRRWSARILGVAPTLHALFAAILFGVVSFIIADRNMTHAPRSWVTLAQDEFLAIEKASKASYANSTQANDSIRQTVGDDNSKRLAQSPGIDSAVAPRSWVTLAQDDSIRQDVGDMSKRLAQSPDMDSAALDELTKKTGEVCRRLNNLYSPKLFLEGTEGRPGYYDCHAKLQPVYSEGQSAIDTRYVTLGIYLDNLWTSLATLGQYRSDAAQSSVAGSNAAVASAAGASKTAQNVPAKIVFLQTFLSACFALVAALTFGVAVRFGRVQQFANQLDRSDDTKINRLRQQAADWLKQEGKDISVDQWLATPNDSVMNLTPAEGVRYQQYRRRLFDSIPLKPQQSPPMLEDRRMTPETPQTIAARMNKPRGAPRKPGSEKDWSHLNKQVEQAGSPQSSPTRVP